MAGLDPDRVAANLDEVRERLAPHTPRILAAVKYLPLEDLPALRAGGVTLFGENRAQELVVKQGNGPQDVERHFIGQLQSRKVKDLVGRTSLIHSVASDSALRELGKHAAPDFEVLLEVDVAGEASKAGFAAQDLDRAIEACGRAGVVCAGLMTMPPFVQDPEDNRRHFARLKELADARGLRELSMGTSQDFEVAAEEGATIVRLGSVLFG